MPASSVRRIESSAFFRAAAPGTGHSHRARIRRPARPRSHASSRRWQRIVFRISTRIGPFLSTFADGTHAIFDARVIDAQEHLEESLGDHIEIAQSEIAFRKLALGEIFI